MVGLLISECQLEVSLFSKCDNRPVLCLSAVFKVPLRNDLDWSVRVDLEGGELSGPVFPSAHKFVILTIDAVLFCTIPVLALVCHRAGVPGVTSHVDQLVHRGLQLEDVSCALLATPIELARVFCC